MTNTNKSYRIKTNVGSSNTDEYISISADLIQDYDTFEVLSVNIKSKDAYNLHNSNYGVVVGRVIANNGFGIPNAKVSIFIPSDGEHGEDIDYLYPFATTVSKNKEGYKYNLLPNERVNGCHQVVGSFPSKRYMLDNDVMLEVFDDYYSYTTRTNNTGDYMICGVPVGAHTLHMDLDLSDCGILSQKPRDFVYKGYTIEQFESPTKFKGGNDYNNLSQVFSQDQIVNVNPFWGNDSLGETIGITRADINVNFKFEPTCVFIGSIISDNASNGFSKKCVPTENMGNMEELVTGEGKIEMIRKTPGGSVEQFSIKGDKLINANGVWCYQIPMNLDYMVTDEYGNMVPTDNPETGIPTRASVRFRISMEDSEENTDNFFRGKVLVPHNPQILEIKTQNSATAVTHENYDYEFGTYTREESFRDLFWNNVYSVKSYIPRIQKSNGWRRKPKFSGIKHCQNFGPNNPMPYNNIRIKLPLMFTIMCVLIKTFVFITKIVNSAIAILGYFSAFIGTRKFLSFDKHPDASWWWLSNWQISWAPIYPKAYSFASNLKMVVLKDGLCPDLENWFFAPIFNWAHGFMVGRPGEKSNGKKTGWFYGFKILKKSNDGLLNREGLCGCATQENDGGDEGDFVPTDDFNSQNHDDEIEVESKWYDCTKICGQRTPYNLMRQTIFYVIGEEEGDSIDDDDPHSIDDQNADTDDETHCLTTKTDYLLPCIEMNLAQEYKVINFDFYNDWINGVIYNPRWVRYKKKKVRFLWITWAKEKIKGCMDDTTIFSRQRKYVQQCSVGYKRENIDAYSVISKVNSPIEYKKKNGVYIVRKPSIVRGNNLHKKRGLKIARVFGKNGGICHEGTTLKGQKVYYLKPCEFNNEGKKVNLYATDIILLGTFNDCDLNGIPQTFNHLVGTTYVMPTNLALTNMDTNGPLYAQDDGTICMGSGNGFTDNYSYNSATTNTGIIYDSGCGATVGIREVDQTFRNEIEYYKNSENDDIRDVFGDNTYNDTIPLTEAAGISWNYTGPGQGTINEEKIYYPGGHFLGLSCVNSQTNLKSCINLSRICEIGANMSQRREDVREIDEDGRLRYTYSVPSGFISGDDIIDTDFRTMFATLNQRRLKATKRNPNTGYKVYDFEFEYPLNFNGAFKTVVYDITYNEQTPYNMGIEVEDEDLTEYGIYRGSENEDYDDEEPENTQTRTREMTNIDYYSFRFGLGHKQMKLGSIYSKYKFLGVSDSTYFLPQYENSYYFYFGIKQGATALDEFNKQFYSECDDLKIKKQPDLILAGDIDDFCHGKGSIRVITEGLSLPYQSIEVYSHSTGLRYVIGTRHEYSAEMAVLHQEMFYLPFENYVKNEFEFGKYTVTIIDDDDIQISKDIEIGVDLFNYNYSIVNFTKPIDGNGNSVFNIFNGGFVLVEGFICQYIGEPVEYVFQLKDPETDEFIGTHEYIEYPDDDIYWHLAYGVNKDKDYLLYLRYRCDGETDFVNLKMGWVRFTDNSYLELRIGKDDVYYRKPLTDSSILNSNSESWWWDGGHYDIGCEAGTDDYKKWFYRKMFFKQSNHGIFDSNVYAHGGRKVFWGVPQNTGNFAMVNGWSNIYCSERDYEIPSGMYLDDTKTIKPTYGINECTIEEQEEQEENGGETRSSDEGNCTYNYCAQAYNGDEVSFKYGMMFDKNHHYNNNDLQQYSNYGANYFHDGYGCVFKPLPYGNLVFMEYGDTDEMLSVIDENTTAKFGIIYPTFIYPVMKRPFFVDFKFIIWNNVSVRKYFDSLGNSFYNELDKDYGYKTTFNVHNGVTFDEEFKYIRVLGENLDDEADYCDAYGLTEESSSDRMLIDVENKDFCISETEYAGIISAEIQEKKPYGHDELGEFVKTYSVYEYYNFISNIVYRLDDETGKIDYVSVPTSDDIVYYIGHYSSNDNNIEFLESRNRSFDGKYAYIHDGNRYVVLCRFTESMSLSVDLWYTTVLVYITDVDDGTCFIEYRYVNEHGANMPFNKFVSFYGDSTSHPYAINEVLDVINGGGMFTDEDGNRFAFPFKPILNYKVKDILEINGVVYDDFDRFMQRMIQMRCLMPVEHLDRLNPVSDDSVVFAIGVKIIPSTEDNEITSNIYKVYPNILRGFYNDTMDGFELTVRPDPYSSSASGSNSTTGSTANGNPYSVGKGEHTINMTVKVESPCLVYMKLEDSTGWCEFSVNGQTYTDDLSVPYNGIQIPVMVHILPNTSLYDRTCRLRIMSYYGRVRDSVTATIRQKGRTTSPNANVVVFQDSPEEIDNQAFLESRPYSYRLNITATYEQSDTAQNYLRIRPDGRGAVRDNPYTPVFHNPEFIPNEIQLRPGVTFEKRIVVNNCNVARYNIPFLMYESSEINDENSDYNLTEIRYEYY